ncbi:MAG: septum formation protein Maf [Candidatus Pacebacteria bacterium]|jgi:septum formation protein|nr:septum formation protein Maf [Candidatus Paceibacterota bacterium]MBT3512236.1 septum formation protein Maf [Candidatus Paceibacterota bacterium]MBT4004846.1 septum formation protein Maf [Candidatus Paceibacterota bacterium]MBT4359314.1 septum formation protein Maf [Candidatus Paceibacterota bacterium]MBT4680935.1 septum formation protein Maf [Candidatus Paceibacterota bacterium]
MNRKIILASQSPQRRNLMKSLNIDFEVIPADIDEQAVVAADPKVRAGLVAEAKAREVQKKYPQDIIIAADTYIVLDGETLEKPVDLEEAREMLRKQSGRSMSEMTGFCYLDLKSGIEVVTTAVAEVEFRELSEAEIEQYVTTQPVMTWSAAFCPAYDSGATLIKSINGSFTGFTHGLPLEELIPLLQQSKVL